jgi:uncharacterized ion transporter superfamily protein YfcC
LQPVPAWLPAHAVVAGVTGTVLVAAGAAIAAGRGLRIAADAVTALWSVWLLAGHAPIVVANPRNGSAWTAAFEALAIGGAAAVLALPARPALGRLAFGITLPVFGALHYVYRDYVAHVIPGWIPGHMFWALATGVAHVAAGIAIVTGHRARLAATLAAVMFGAWVVILHAPRVAADPKPAEWTSLLVAVAMCGGAWLVAGSGRGRSSRSRR